MILVILQVILVFNFLILVHELGHYLAARWRGLKVEKFQIWFGKPIWKKTINGVQWGLGSIPAGGFVALPQMGPMEMLEGKNDEVEEGEEPLKPVSPLDKIIVALAGPVFSLGLAFAFACVVWKVGYPTNVNASTTIGYVVPGTPAEAAGLKQGDEILEIDGDKVVAYSSLLDSVIERIAMSRGDDIVFKVQRPGVAEPLEIVSGFERPETKLFNRPGLRKVGISESYVPNVRKLYPGSPAEVAGLQVGDVIEAVNGTPIYSHYPIQELVKANPTESVVLTIQRGEETKDISITPATPNAPADMSPMLGLIFGGLYDEEQKLDYPNPFAQIRDSLRLMYRTITAVASPKTDIKISHMSGAVGIGHRYYDMLTMPNGWRMVFWFSVILNVNLAVLNMLPFPVLDGGHIVIATLEGIRRKPIKLKVLEVIQVACALALISFMLYVTWFDGTDIVNKVKSGQGGAGPPEIHFGKPADVEG